MYVYRNPALSKPSLWYVRLCTGAYKHTQLAQRIHAPVQEVLGLCTNLTFGTLDVYSMDFTSLILDFSSHLKSVGKEEEAALALQQATRICRTLFELPPDTIDAHFARSAVALYRNLRYAGGKKEEEIAVSDTVVSAFKHLAASSPDTYDNELTRSLNESSLLLRGTDREADALEAAEEIVAIYRKQANKSDQAAPFELSAALEDMSYLLIKANREADALRADEEVMTVCRKLGFLESTTDTSS